MRIFFPLLALTTLAACADMEQPRQLASSRPTVTYGHAPGDEAATAARARSFCAQYGMTPVVARSGMSGGERIVQFDCR
jgi:hypothetical protein